MVKTVLGAAGALVAVIVAAVAAVFGSVLGGATAPGPAAVADIPADYLTLYETAAAGCPGLAWSVLAGVGKVESDHGRSRAPGVRSGANYAGAMGPMQFLRPTFTAVTARHPPPPGGADPPSPYNPSDAIHTAAAYLCDNGARNNHDIRTALFTYNHSTAYIDHVLDVAHDYAAAAPASPGVPGGPGPLTGQVAAQVAVAYALSHLGEPYLWGGDGPDNGDAGFDCSGLTTAAYTAAGIHLPRTADTQYHAGPAVPPGTALAAGDLVFFGDPRVKITHVAIYLGNGQIVQAPRRGQPVQIAKLADMRRYAGASRPAALTTQT